MQWPFVSRALYRNVLRQLAVERRRADAACTALERERFENNRMTRHMTNMFLRKSNTFPLVDKTKLAEDAPPMQITRGPKYDAGELDALVKEAERLGLGKDAALSFFKKEKGLDDTDLLM